jgi:hypothetical protein
MWHALLLGLVLCSACSSKDSDGEDTVGAFDGAWELSDERGVFNCGDGDRKSMLGGSVYTMRVELRGSRLELHEVDQGDIEIVLCTYEYDLNGSRALLDGAQSCKHDPPMGESERGPWTTTWTTGELALDGDSLHDRGEWHDTNGCSGRSDSTYTRRPSSR